MKIKEKQPVLRNLVPDIDRLREIMTFMPGDTRYNFQRFLQKFHVLNHVRWNEESIDIAIEQVVRDLKEENLDYTELRFSIDKYLNHINWDETEACLFFLNRLGYWTKIYGVYVGPVLCLKYETPKKQATRLSKVVNSWQVGGKLVGIDFVSDEAFFDVHSLRQHARYWRCSDKGVLAHVGETQSAANVRVAIEDLKVTRIAHGITAANDPEILKLANDNGVAFDVSLSSNMMTGVVSDMGAHPIQKMLEAGCTITIGTDDPITFRTDLDKEYQLLQETVGLSDDEIEKIKKNSIEASLVKH